MNQYDLSLGVHRNLISSDGTALHFIEFTRDGNTQTLLILHGASEHGARYSEFSEYLLTHGVNSVLMDLRGYGASGGKRAYWPDFNTSSTDVSMIAADILNRKQTLHLLGNSMGGLLAARCAATLLKEKIASLNLSSPCFKLEISVSEWKIALAHILNILYPSFTLQTPIQPEILTHDNLVIDRYLNDTNMTHKMSARLFCELQQNMRDCHTFAENIKCPTLILQAEKDSIVSVDGARAFYDRLRSQHKVFETIPGAFHEILQEVNRPNVYAKFLNHLLHYTQ